MPVTFNLADAFVTLGTRGEVAGQLQRAKDLAGNLNKEFAKTSQSLFVDLARQQQQASLAQTRLNIAQALAQAEVTGSGVQTRALAARMVLQEKLAALHVKQEGVLSGLIGKDEHRRAVAAGLAAESERNLNALRQQAVAAQEQAKALATPAGRAAAFAGLVTRARGDTASAGARQSQAEAAGTFAGSQPARAAASANVGADLAEALAGRRQEIVLLQERAKLLATPAGAAVQKQANEAQARAEVLALTAARRQELGLLQERAKFLTSSAGTAAIQEQIRLVKETAAAQKSVDWATKVAELGRFGAMASAAREKVGELASALGGVAAAAGALGAVSFAGMIKFAEVASPARASLFNFAMRDLAGTIGQVFLPVLDKATTAVRGFADWVINLTPKAKAMFAAVAVGAAAGVAAFGAFAAAVGVATAAMLAFNAVTGGILIAVGTAVTAAAAAFAGLAAAIAMTDSGMSAFGRLAKSVGDLFGSMAATAGAVFSALSPVFDFMAGAIGAVAELIKPVISAFKELAVTVTSILSGPGGEAIMKFGKFVAEAVFYLSGVGPMVTLFVTTVVNGFTVALNVVERFAAVVGVIGKTIQRAMTINPFEIARALADVPDEISKAFAEIDEKHEKARKELEGGKPSTGAGGGGQAAFTGIAEARQQFAVAALQATVGGAKDPNEQVAQNTEPVPGLLQQLIDAVRGHAEGLAQ